MTVLPSWNPDLEVGYSGDGFWAILSAMVWLIRRLESFLVETGNDPHSIGWALNALMVLVFLDWMLTEASGGRSAGKALAFPIRFCTAIIGFPLMLGHTFLMMSMAPPARRDGALLETGV
jgi:hypothetical protein